MTLTPLTELEAVNEILASIGESPVNTIENPTNVDVINCLRILRNVNRRVQSKGWTFNKIDSYTLNPDASTHKIRWLSNLLYVVGTDNKKYTKKGTIFLIGKSRQIFLTIVLIAQSFSL